MLMMNATRADLASFGTMMGPDDIKAHIEFMMRLNEDLKKSGELVDAQGLSSPHEAKLVRARTKGAPDVTDGPFAESKEFLAGYWILDVRDFARMVEIAARISAAPGKDGKPLNFAVEVRPIGEPPKV